MQAFNAGDRVHVTYPFTTLDGRRGFSGTVTPHRTRLQLPSCAIDVVSVEADSGEVCICDVRWLSHA